MQIHLASNGLTKKGDWCQKKEKATFKNLFCNNKKNSLKCRYRRGHLYRQNSFIKRGGSLEKGCLRKLERFRVALIRRNRYNE